MATSEGLTDIASFGPKTIQMVQTKLRKSDYKQPLCRARKIRRTDAGYRVTDGNIAAIDFGTTSVSLAYTTKGDDADLVNTLVLNTENYSKRVPNAMLLKKEGRKMTVAAFGNVARKRFTTMRPNQYKEHIYFERIKMLMRRENSIDRQSLVESFSGEKFYLVEVIAFILKYLKDQLIDHLSRTAKPLKTTDFDWVITVPAIWDARGKRMMREAAYLAGLLTPEAICQLTKKSFRDLPTPSEVNPDKLSLALEPEAAALYSQEMVVKQIKSDPPAAAIGPPSEYMVIDIGGGTVDITAHIEVDGGIVVENIPSGNEWGGTQVNEAFSKMLQKLVCDHKFQSFIASGDHSQNMADLIRLLYKEFEDEKTLFGRGETDEVRIVLPTKFGQFYQEALKDGVKKMSGIEYEDDSIYIDKEVVESQLFGPALDGIIECTLEAIENNSSDLSTFYLVGGFGGCKYVHEKVTAAIEEAYSAKGRSCTVLVPPTPQLAVATGAVMWRKNPEKIKARRSDATYGIGSCPVFDSTKHDEHYKYTDNEDQCERCNNVFNVFLEKGELASADSVITTEVIPFSQSDTKMFVTIRSTHEFGIEYIKDKEGESTVNEIGQLVLNIPNPNNLPREKRTVDITMDFSGTEIQAKAKYNVTGDEVKTVCDFLSAQ